MLSLALSFALLGCLNETTMAHDEAKALVVTARRHLEQGRYADAARTAARAAHALGRRVAIGEGEASGRAFVSRSADVAALATARTVLAGAVVRSNATVDTRGRAVSPSAPRQQAYEDAYALVLQARAAAPSDRLAREVEAELQVRSANLRREGKATLRELGQRDLLSAPEAMAALATVFAQDGAANAAERYQALCVTRAAVASQCAAVVTDAPPTARHGSGLLAPGGDR